MQSFFPALVVGRRRRSARKKLVFERVHERERYWPDLLVPEGEETFRVWCAVIKLLL